MSQKPFDPEVQQDVETVFDCCGGMVISIHTSLLSQLQDGANNPAPSDLGADFYNIWLTSNDVNNLIDMNYTWNPAVPNAVGRVKLLPRAQGNCTGNANATADAKIPAPPA